MERVLRILDYVGRFESITITKLIAKKFELTKPIKLISLVVRTKCYYSGQLFPTTTTKNLGSN